MKERGLKDGIARGDSVVIVYGKRPRVRKTIWYGFVTFKSDRICRLGSFKLSCSYSQHPGHHGWCGTCVK